MNERTLETGGEVLRVGSMVIVFDGNSQRERAVTQIGTKRIHVESIGRGAPIPFDRETRRGLQAGYSVYFRTRTEVTAYARHDAAKARLRDLGMDPIFLRGSDPTRYSVEVLEQVIGILEASSPK